MNSFKAYSFQHHREVYGIIDDIFSSLGFNYYLIGANARDVQLYKAGIKPTRSTADIDFAVMVPSIDDYQLAIDRFLDRNFQKTNLAYRIIFSKTNTIIDILPYGEFAEEYTLNFDQRDLELSILGFSEVGTAVEKFQFEENFAIPVSPAHGLVILKLISWNERNDRNKDLKDIRSILDAAWELYHEELYTENSIHFDLLEIEPFEIHITAARILGRKMKSLLEKCEPLENTICTILQNEIDNPSGMTIGMSVNQDTEQVILLLSSILQGILDN